MSRKEEPGDKVFNVEWELKLKKKELKEERDVSSVVGEGLLRPYGIATVRTLTFDELRRSGSW